MTNHLVLAEGKTKRICEWPGDMSLVLIQNKDDLTAGDGAKHDTFEGKAKCATETTCNVFAYLASHGLPVAYERWISETEFLAKRCRMLPYEVVARGIALGSYLKRNPTAEKGERFEPPRVEFYLKSKDRVFHGVKLPKDDPFITNFDAEGVIVHDPSVPVIGIGIRIPADALEWGAEFDTPGKRINAFIDMEEVARLVFLALRAAWAVEKMTLADLKIEFGLTMNGKLVVADVIDNDSWRVLDDAGEHQDKQLYRDGVPLEVVATKYKSVAEATGRFLSVTC